MTRIRAERPSDRERVFEIQAAAFGQLDEAKLVDALRARARPQLSLVAESEGEIVGHVFFSPVSVESRGAPPVAGLAPVGVDPRRQRAGIGSALVREGLRQCPGHGWRAVFLVGDPGYYSRFGFALAEPLGFRYGNPLFDSALQVTELFRGALQGHVGPVHFHPAFDETGTG